VTRLRKMMLEELERRNYSEGTTRRYLRHVERFAQHFGKSPDKLGLDHLRTYQAYLLKVRAPGRHSGDQRSGIGDTETHSGVPIYGSGRYSDDAHRGNLPLGKRTSRPAVPLYGHGCSGGARRPRCYLLYLHR
jgi:hypothetical protein